MAIDFAPLGRIQRLLKLAPLPAGRNTSSVFVYGPNDPAAYVTLQPNGIVTKDTRLVLLTKERAPEKRISRLIRRAFIIGRAPEPELPWERLRELIRSATSKRESGTIKAVAGALDDIVDDYLETQHAVSGEGSMVLEDSIGRIVYHFTPPDPPELRLSDLAVDAARSDSAECLEQLLTCIYRLALRAFRRRNVKYFREWTFELHTAYHLAGSPRDDAKSHVTSGIVERIGWLSQYLFDTHFYNHAKLPGQVKEVSPYAMVFLDLCLHMLKTSAERSDKSTFGKVSEHLGRFLKRDLEDNDIKACLDVYRAGDRRKVSQSMPAVYVDRRGRLAAYDDIYDYKTLVHVLVGAWLMHEVEGHELGDEEVSCFIERIIANTPGFRELLDLYAMPGMADMATNRENPLMFHTWDWPYSQAKGGTAFQRWIRPFYQFLLLKKAALSPLNKIDLRDIRETSGADHDSLTAFLAEIVSGAYVVPALYQGIPWGMEDGTLALAKTRISELMTSWAGESGKGSADAEEGNTL